MSRSDDAKRLHAQEVAIADDVKRRESDPALGGISLLARTTTVATYPATAQSYYACQPLILLGTEVEGGAGNVAAASSPFFALNLGTTIPPPGSQILVTRVDSRWVFRFDS